jgi:RecA-family ATPase
VEFSLRDLGALAIVSLDGEDAVLSAPDRSGQMAATRVFKRLRETVLRLGPSLLVLDTLADLFGGDEIKRTHTRQFIGLLRGLIRETGVTIVLLAHPSLSGMASGSGTSGSTAWNNSVRSRLYLKRSLGRDGEEKDADIRTLTTMKANRAKIGDEITVRYRSGVFLREAAASAEVVASRESKADETFLKLLDAANAEGREVTHSLRSQNYAPRRFETDTQAGGLVKKDFEEAMERLFSSKRIAVAEYGPPSNRHVKIVKSDLEAKNKSLFD